LDLSIYQLPVRWPSSVDEIFQELKVANVLGRQWYSCYVGYHDSLPWRPHDPGHY
jgi:hypothetical protein